MFVSDYAFTLVLSNFLHEVTDCYVQLEKAVADEMDTYKEEWEAALDDLETESAHLLVCKDFRFISSQIKLKAMWKLLMGPVRKNEKTNCSGDQSTKFGQFALHVKSATKNGMEAKDGFFALNVALLSNCLVIFF